MDAYLPSRPVGQLAPPLQPVMCRGHLCKRSHPLHIAAHISGAIRHIDGSPSWYNAREYTAET